MTADLRLMSFTSGTNTGDFTGDHAASYVVLCGVSGATTIPIRVLNDGSVVTSGAQNRIKQYRFNSKFSSREF